jgi:hypothetical protein
MNRAKKLRLAEFLVIGVGMGLLEDLIAVGFATDDPITWKVVVIVLAVAIPFAFISEVVVDHPKFWEVIWPDRDKDGFPDAFERKR